MVRYVVEPCDEDLGDGRGLTRTWSVVEVVGPGRGGTDRTTYQSGIRTRAAARAEAKKANDEEAARNAARTP